MAQRKRKLDKKKQIIEHVFQVFYKNGFHATGLESLLEGTGISKRTLYKYFSSKDELIAAAVEHYSELISDKLRDQLRSLDAKPADQILALFDVQEQLMVDLLFPGCFAFKALQEFEQRNEEITNSCNLVFSYLKNYFVTKCKEINAADHEVLGMQIYMLFRGAIAASQQIKSALPFQNARKAVVILLSSNQN